MIASNQKFYIERTTLKQYLQIIQTKVLFPKEHSFKTVKVS